MTLFLLWNVKEDILRNDSYSGSQWSPKRFGYQHSSKYFILCSTEDSHTGLEENEGDLNYDRIFILG